MESKKVTYCTKLFNPVKCSFYSWLVLMLGIFLILTIVRSLQSEIAIYILVPIWISMPLFFQEKIKDLFRNKVKLGIDEKAVTISILDRMDVVQKETTFYWDEIKSYKFYFSQTNVSFLTIYFKNGSSNSFTFVDEKTQEKAIKEKSVFSIFHYFVSVYNQGKEADDSIAFTPGLYNTKAGVIGVVSFFSIILISIFASLKYKPDMVVVPALFGVSMFLALLGKRVGDNNMKKAIDQLTPRSPFDQVEDACSC